VELLENRARVVRFNGVDDHLIVYDPNEGLWSVMRIVETNDEPLYEPKLGDGEAMWYSTNAALNILEGELHISKVTTTHRSELAKILWEIRTSDPESEREDAGQ
jgi:hypothetical protein